MKFLIVVFFVCTALLLFNNCDSTDPKLEPELVLKLEDVSCTEAWLQLTTTNIQLPSTINILKNNSVTQTFSLSTKDSLLYIDSLLPNQSYKFKVVINTTNNPQPATNEVLAQTIDTTSHNFTWQTFEFGQHSSSVLYDVAIINENNIWAVGEIHMNDSLGNPDPKRYNAVKWNGSTWDVIRIPYNFQGTDFYNPIQSVFAFNNNDIWFCGNGVIHWNGSEFTPIPIPTNVWGPYQMNKIWGTSSNDLYVVGSDGNIAHYNGTIWSKIESGTTTILNDAWGITNEQNKTIVYCAASSFFVPGDKKILKIVDGKVDSVNWGKDVRLYSAWTNNENFLYVCGEGVFVNKLGTWEQINLPAITSNSIRGNDINDVFAVGSMGTIFHLNGINWQVISSYTQKENYRVDFKNNTVAICGYNNGKGFIEIGRRN